MTIHKAKGLEFETVIIPGLGRGFPPGQRPLLMWQERPRPNGGEDLLLAPLPPLGQEPDASYKFIQSMDKEKDRLEQGRVLYVAATRAREHLHLLGHVQARPGQPLRPRSDSLLALLWPVVQGEFEAKRGLSAQGKRLVDEPEADQWLRRLPQDWQRPEVPVVPPAVQIEPSKPLGPERPEFNWAGELMRSIGVVVHRWLMHITLEGLQDWDADRVVDQGQVFRVDLANEGVCAAELDSAVSKVQKALLQTLEDQQGAWLLSPQEKGRCEYPLTGILDGRVYSVVLDRTFVDESDRRWIVDYKTGWHQDQDQAEFLAAEVRRYRPQLEAYARLAALWETRPIRLGLYFPLIQAWREWAWT
jgi:ATP-dependent exoDNAse (exonuclease V) beta subunit